MLSLCHFWYFLLSSQKYLSVSVQIKGPHIYHCSLLIFHSPSPVFLSSFPLNLSLLSNSLLWFSYQIYVFSKLGSIYKRKYVIFICIEMFYFDLLCVPAPVWAFTCTYDHIYVKAKGLHHIYSYFGFWDRFCHWPVVY